MGKIKLPDTGKLVDDTISMIESYFNKGYHWYVLVGIVALFIIVLILKRTS